MPLHRHWFTPETAQRILSQARPAVDNLRRIYRELERRRPDRIRPDARVDPDYFRLLRKLHALLAWFRSRGILVRDLELGWLDFPARRAGKRVMLCWRAGESALAFWYDPGAGPRGKRRLDPAGPWDRSGPGDAGSG
jgi:hypothetical protein